jgi:hypothetical protein
MDSILPDIRVGAAVARGQWVGMLGKRGASGNFSHLHVGMYLSGSDMAEDRMCRSINLYPWLVSAYRAASGAKLCAVAGPHHTVLTGETVVFDGSNSLTSGSGIASCRWVFHDGTGSIGPRAQKIYEKSGCYPAALWVEDGLGGKDVGFCTVRVFSRSAPEASIPTLFATFVPAADCRAGQPIHFRIWPQGREVESIQVDFGDRTVLRDYVPYSAVTHIFREPGIHVVTVRGASGGIPVMQKLEVVVVE